MDKKRQADNGVIQFQYRMLTFLVKYRKECSRCVNVARRKVWRTQPSINWNANVSWVLQDGMPAKFQNRKADSGMDEINSDVRPITKCVTH